MKLKELRISKGVSQKEVAISIGCSSLNYSRYERENASRIYKPLKPYQSILTKVSTT